VTCTLTCRCSHPQHAHTGAWGCPTACTGGCGCSYFEPDLPAPVPVVPALSFVADTGDLDVLDGSYDTRNAR
jgi:hypothetical protein